MLHPDAADKVLRYMEKNRDFFKPWLPAFESDHFTLEYNRTKLAYEMDEMKNGAMVKYWLFKKDDLNEENIIGDLTYSYIVRGAFWSCWLGYKIDKDMNGNGYATQSIQGANGYLFNDLHLHRIEANIMPRNQASIRVVEKCGFICEGLSKKYLKINDIWEDHLHYVLLNNEVE